MRPKRAIKRPFRYKEVIDIDSCSQSQDIWDDSDDSDYVDDETLSQVSEF